MSKQLSTSTEPRTDVERKVATQLDAAVLRGDGAEALRLRQTLKWLRSGPPIMTTAEAKRPRRPVYMQFTGQHGLVRGEDGKPVTSSTVANLITKARAALARIFK